MTTPVRMIAAALAAIAVWPTAATPAAEQVTGGVTGRVTLTASTSAPLATSPYGRRDVAPKQSENVPDRRKVIVYVSGVRPTTPPVPMRARIAQRHEQFVPPLIAVTTRSSVDFPNEDPFFHNVFSLSKTATFDLGRYPSGSSRMWPLPKPGIVKVFCHLHSQMSATIMVLDHPWFTIPADDGSFTLPAVPAGDLTVVAWHERIGERRERVRVQPGETVKIALTLPLLEPRP